MKRHHDDMSSREGAMLLAETINDYWRTRGYNKVNARIFSLGDGFPSSHHGEGENLERWGVTSDLVAGMPR